MVLLFAIGCLCIAIMVAVATLCGYDTGLVTGGVGAIVSILTWQGVRLADRRGNNISAVSSALKKAGYTDSAIAKTVSKIKGGE